MTENQKKWLNDLYDEEIKEAAGAACNEHIWALGSDTVDESTEHEDNCEELKQYIEILKKLKEKVNHEF